MKNVVMGCFALGLVLAGCGGDKAAAPEGADKAAEAPSEEKKEGAAEEKKGG